MLEEPCLKMIIKPTRTQVSSAVIAMLVNNVLHAGSFSLYTEASPAAIGNFGAGIAAEAADASIGWYNPAGLVLIKHQQAVFGGVGVFPSAKLSGVSTYTTIAPDGESIIKYTQPFRGLSGAESAGVPSFHYALPLSDSVVFGLSIVSPFGLSTNYGKTSAVRYSATSSELQTIDISPELGWLISDHLSFGIGLDLQYARVKFNSMIGAPALLESVSETDPATIDSQSINVGDSFSAGFHTGLMLMFHDNHTRIGFNYQSAVNHKFQGSSRLAGRLADPSLNIFDDPGATNPNASYRTDNLYSNNIDLPAMMTLSAYQDLNEKWALLGSFVYSIWSSFKTISLTNVAAGVPNPASDSDPDLLGAIIQQPVSKSVPEYYQDSWRFAVGANYHVNDKWMMRGGVGYDQTPTVNEYRDVRIPDADRWALSIGTHYQYRPSIGFDLGYTYLFGNTQAIINETTPISQLSATHVYARGNSHAHLLGLQVVWTIDKEKETTK